MYTTSDLLDSIKRRSFAPTGQRTFTDEELLALADEETQTTLLPDILSVREEFFINLTDYAITADQAAYDVPARSIGLQVRDVHLIDGVTVNPDLPRLEPERINSAATGQPQAFYLKNNSVCLFPTPSSTTKTLRLYFPLRPSRLIATSNAAIISAINGSVITVSSIPSAWVTGDTFDLIRQDGGQECLLIDSVSTLISGSDITLSAIPSTLRVGDYIALQDESPLVQLPPDYRSILAQAVAVVVLESMNQPGADRARKQLDAMRKTAIKLITPRTPGEERVIVSNTWSI